MELLAALFALDREEQSASTSFVVTSVDLRFLRAARLFRLMRVAKLAMYSSVLSTFARVLSAKKEELVTMSTAID